MRLNVRASMVAIGLATALAGSAYRIVAASPVQGGQRAAARQDERERHPVLRQSMRQLEGIRDRLQQAPTDFGGHREAAVDAINHAINELQQAVQFDKR